MTSFFFSSFKHCNSFTFCLLFIELDICFLVQKAASSSLSGRKCTVQKIRKEDLCRVITGSVTGADNRMGFAVEATVLGRVGER